MPPSTTGIAVRVGSKPNELPSFGTSTTDLAGDLFGKSDAKLILYEIKSFSSG